MAEGFQRLSPIVWLWQPPTDTTSSNKAPLFVLATWMDAPVRLIDRYASQIKVRFPESTIVLITSASSNFFFTSESRYRSLLTPALHLLQQRDREKDVIALSFSNGGALTLTQLAKGYRKAAGDPLTIRNLVLDSAPGSAELIPAYAAISAGFPPAFNKGPLPLRILASVLLWSFLAVIWILCSLPGITDSITVLRRDLNNILLFQPRTRRTYIYSRSDEMVQDQAVESSAKEAQEKGWDTKLELFSGKHVAHAVGEKERYWRVVQEGLGG